MRFDQHDEGTQRLAGRTVGLIKRFGQRKVGLKADPPAGIDGIAIIDLGDDFDIGDTTPDGLG
ncbi:MAG: hypothetical protein AAFR46_17935 [Pseudomonadota bacterium]